MPLLRGPASKSSSSSSDPLKFSASSAAFEAHFDGHRVPGRMRIVTNDIGATKDVDAPPFIAFMQKIVVADVKYTAVIDMRDFRLPSLETVRELGGWCNTRLGDFDRIQLAIAVLLADNFLSTTARWTINLITALAPPNCPLLICHNEEAAEAFFLEHLEQSIVRVDAFRQRFVRQAPPGSGTIPGGQLPPSATAASSHFAEDELKADEEAFDPREKPDAEEVGRVFDIQVLLMGLYPSLPNVSCRSEGWPMACCIGRYFPTAETSAASRTPALGGFFPV